jgi:chromosomal replication initiation ATPase DnaA
MYLAHVMLGLSYSATGRLFERDRTTAAYACRLVEDRRDDPAVDHVLLKLEDTCAALARDAGLQLPVQP